MVSLSSWLLLLAECEQHLIAAQRAYDERDVLVCTDDVDEALAEFAADWPGLLAAPGIDPTVVAQARAAYERIRAVATRTTSYRRRCAERGVGDHDHKLARLPHFAESQAPGACWTGMSKQQPSSPARHLGSKTAKPGSTGMNATESIRLLPNGEPEVRYGGMSRKQLADALRARMRSKNPEMSAIAASASDDDIIASYTTNSCGESELAEPGDLDVFLRHSRNLEEFFEILDRPTGFATATGARWLLRQAEGQTHVHEEVAS